MVSNRGTVGGLAQRTGAGHFYKPFTKRGVIAQYGAFFSEDGWFDQQPDAVRAITGMFPIASTATFNYWGNDALMANMTTLLTNAKAKLFANAPVHLLGISAGGLSCLNWAKNNPTLVKSISLVIPVINVQGVWDEDRVGAKFLVDAAYGGRPPDDHNPLDYAASLPDVPIRLYCSENDPYTTFIESIDFAALAGAEAISMGPIGHAVGAPWGGEAVALFMRANDV